MIKEIKISNFKSVQDLTLQLGRINVFIGSNGSGKSNILEAIAFAGAASANKLDNEFLGSRGIRTASAQLMKNAFKDETSRLPITLNLISEKSNLKYTIEEEDKPILKWFIKEKGEIEKILSGLISSVFDNNDNEIKKLENVDEEGKDQIANISSQIKTFTSGIANNEKDKDDFTKFLRNFIASNASSNQLYKEFFYNNELVDFIIYSPEISSLRKFEEESQIKPLGIRGEGIFNVLQIFNENYGKETIDELKKHLHIIEWFDDFEAIYDNASGRRNLVVKDRYIPNIALNQNNVNEGFLFLLFYLSLIVSKETPSFFAIDNIEASFHPLLCTEMTKNLVKSSKKHNKQMILTTHNPFVLDGLDLSDPEQALFVVRRNSEGETIADRITEQPKNIKLSEAWLRGRFGGLPETIE